MLRVFQDLRSRGAMLRAPMKLTHYQFSRRIHNFKVR